MSQATLVWSIWKDLLGSCKWAFQKRGFPRFAEWITAPSDQCRGAHDHSVRARPRPARRLESPGVLRRVRRLARQLRHAVRRGSSRRPRPGSGMATISGRSTTPRSIAATPTFGAPARSMSTPHAAPTAPPPSEPTTGSFGKTLLPNPDQPAWFLPMSGRLYFRKSQLPERPDPPQGGGTERFHTKCELAGGGTVREQAKLVDGPHLAVFDGGYALRNVVRPLVHPEDGSPRIEFLTRLRHDARLFCSAAQVSVAEIIDAKSASPEQRR